ncbi:TPA: hypothetical protein U9I82_002917 [Acinetobacter baumannii]|nr:hypothetical protein [Acinetobacter baumannii]HEN9532310.1 hypothetical protein [Acinetobacter baumannii]HEN9567606.1 hypothetical protein [Acinetobacter baumannii]HEO0817180.1 hypothetical protein [Acinetobacter baumannii]
MNKFILFIETMPLVFIGLSCLFFFFVLYFIQYIYISFNLKEICMIIFNNEKHFRLPLEPFNCFFISVLPIVFWRETLNIKYGTSFKKLYKKDFYYPVEKDQLKKLIKKFPMFFYNQYAIYFCGIFTTIALVSVFILEKFF